MGKYEHRQVLSELVGDRLAAIRNHCNMLGSLNCEMRCALQGGDLAFLDNLSKDERELWEAGGGWKEFETRISDLEKKVADLKLLCIRLLLKLGRTVFAGGAGL